MDFSSLQPGTMAKIFYNKGNPNNRTIEIRGVIDDRLVFRQRAKLSDKWFYKIEPLIYFESLHEKGYLQVKGIKSVQTEMI